MRFYLLTLKDADWNHCTVMVVRAKNAKQARRTAAESGKAMGEGKEAWLDPNRTTCRAIPSNGRREVILADVLYG